MDSLAETAQNLRMKHWMPPTEAPAIDAEEEARILARIEQRSGDIKDVRKAVAICETLLAQAKPDEIPYAQHRLDSQRELLQLLIQLRHKEACKLGLGDHFPPIQN